MPLVLALLLSFAIAAVLFYFFHFQGPAREDLSKPKAGAVALPDGAIKDTGLKEADALPPSAGNGEGAEGGALKASYEAMRGGETGKATGILRDALKESPDSEGLRKALASVLNKAALNDYNRADYAGAKERLKEAVSLSVEPVYVRNYANVQLKLNDLRGATETLEGLRADPEARSLLKALYMRLANESYSGGNAGEAVALYEKGLELDPGDNNLRDYIAKLKSEHDVEKSMGRSDGSHFLVKFEGGENAEAGHLIGLLLEEAYYKVGSDLDYYPEERIEALLYSKERFRDVTNSPSWASALYDGRIKIPAGGITERTGELEKVVFHEYTHALIARLAKGRAPVWLNEGMAQHEEGRGPSGYEAEVKAIVARRRPRLKDLEGSFMALNQNDAQAAYLLSLSATSYIIREFGVFSVKKIFEELGRGKTMEDAVSAALYLSYSELEKSWLDSVAR